MVAKSKELNTLINLISGPRNISTALMYSFASRKDTAVVDEPFYASYLNMFPHINHPGQSEVLASQTCDPNVVITELQEKELSTAFYFVKNMAHHCKGYELDYLLDHRSIFLIRHPALILRSFSKVIEHPTADDIGLIKEWELYQWLSEHAKFKPVVLDSTILLEDPPVIIKKLCESIAIPFDSGMLTWKAGARKEDGVWAKYWYDSVHQSTGFAKKTTEIPILGESLNKIMEQVMPAYEALRQKAIQ